MNLDTSALEKAISQLEKSLEFSVSPMAKKEAELFFQFRSASIQAFEYTYELSIKMLRRALEEIEETPATIDQLAYRDLLRTGAENLNCAKSLLARLKK